MGSVFALGRSMTDPAILILGTGGTIAQIGEGAAVIPVEEMIAPSRGTRIVTRQVLQNTSVNLDFVDLRAIVSVVSEAQADPQITGIVLTHGTDTAEETAFLVSQVCALSKPVVLTGAMRTADHAEPDGPRNLADALNVARTYPPGVFACFNGAVYSGLDLVKRDSRELGAMKGVNLGPLSPRHLPAVMAAPLPMPEFWPRVVDLTFDFQTTVEDWKRVAADADGLVVLGSGAGNVPQRLRGALRELASQRTVLRASRTGAGLVTADGETSDHDLGTVAAGWLSPVKARLLLSLGIAAGLSRTAIRARIDEISKIVADYRRDFAYLQKDSA